MSETPKTDAEVLKEFQYHIVVPDCCLQCTYYKDPYCTLIDVKVDSYGICNVFEHQLDSNRGEERG